MELLFAVLVRELFTTERMNNCNLVLSYLFQISHGKRESFAFKLKIFGNMPSEPPSLVLEHSNFFSHALM